MVEILVAFGQWLGAFWNLTIVPGTPITCGMLAVICFILVTIGLVIRSLYGGGMSIATGGMYSGAKGKVNTSMLGAKSSARVSSAGSGVHSTMPRS